MSTIFSEQAANAMLQSLATLIDAGGRAGALEITDGGSRVLATCRFRLPCSTPAEGAKLKFKPLAEDPSCRASGLAAFGRVRDSNGVTIMQLDVGDVASAAAIKLNNPNVVGGAPLRIVEFSLGVAAKTAEEWR